MARKVPLNDFGSVKVRVPLHAGGQRIGVMGGSFNPPHDGHRIVAETAVRRLRLDQLWWLVTPGNPLKDNDRMPPLAARMAACRKFAVGPKMVVTGFEQHLGTPYTAATLAFLRKRFSAVSFVWVMGADNLATFHRWQHWQDIARAMPLAVVDRPGWRLKSLSSPAAAALGRYRIPENQAGMLVDQRVPAWTFLTTRLSSLSSTELRAQAQKDDP